MKYLYLAVILLTSATMAPQTLFAQTFEGLGTQSNALSVSVSPKRPGPNQPVTVTIESFSLDLNRSEISWFLNGKIQTENIGQKTFSFKTGGPGSISNILIVVKTREGTVTEQSLNIRPATVDLIWEAVSYTPPFYKGKALYPFQGTVKVVAIPNIVTQNGGLLDAKNLVYTWKVDGHPATDVSGYGKNFIFFNGGIPLKPTSVTVEVASLDQTYAAEGSTKFSPVQPQVIFYEDSPLLGTLYGKAMSKNTTLQNEEIKITAVPYFAGTRNKEDGNLEYEWQMNNQIVQMFGNKSSLAFRQEKGEVGMGMATVSLVVSNPKKIFQSAMAGLSLSFGNNQ
jgi:hypothetical protein